MKKLIISLALVLFTLAGFSQHSLLTIFTDEGETFHLYVDGKKINVNPESHLCGIKLRNDFHRLKVVGVSEKGMQVSKQMESKDMDGNFCRLTVCIKKNRSGKYKMKVSDFTAIPEEEFSKPKPEVITKVVYVEKESKPVTTKQTKTVVKTSTTTSESKGVSMTVNAKGNKNNKTESVAMNLSVSDGDKSASISFDVEASETSSGTTVVKESSSEETIIIKGGTTTTETSSEETVIINGGADENNNTEVKVIESVVEPHPMPDYKGSIGCENVIWDKEMKEIKKTISNKDYEEARLTVAKAIAEKKCLQAKHVRDIMKLFDFEETRLQFAKFAYVHTFDQDNYYVVYNVLDFDVSIDELKAFVNGEDTNDFGF